MEIVRKEVRTQEREQVERKGTSLRKSIIN